MTARRFTIKSRSIIYSAEVSAVVYLAPAGVSNRDIVHALQRQLAETLRIEVRIIEAEIDLEAVRSADRNQYYSTKIIAQALPQFKESDGKVVIIVDVDLYIPIFTFVFGEAMLNGVLSIVSLCRLHEEFYSGRSDSKLLLARAMKELLHELGHNYGLVHCRNWDCVMHASSGIEEVDIKGSGFCSSCRRSLP